MKKLTFGIILSLFVSTAFSQDALYDKVFDRDIKTVLMYSGDDDLSLPIWDLGSSKKLPLSFDDLNENTRDFSYTIVHCNSEWIPSDLDKSEYIDGYFDDQISEYQSSFNTTINYTHYTLQLPDKPDTKNYKGIDKDTLEDINLSLFNAEQIVQKLASSSSLPEK